MSFFENITALPEDPILSLPIAFSADSREKKVNLGIGAYQTENGEPYILSSVQKAEKHILEQNLDKEYQPIEGGVLYRQETLKLIYGNEAPLDRLSLIQTVGGTSALRLAADFLIKQGYSKVYLSDPSWPNHRGVFQKAGLSVYEYPYYDYEKGILNFEAMREAVENMPQGSIILLHASCHNPTGIDPSNEQWKQLSSIIKQKKIIPFFDLAYQGLGISLEEDVWPIRYFVSQNHEMFVASSFSKSLGLYGERVGSLSWLMPNKEINRRLLSHFKQIVRGIYSNPPLHGGRLVTTVLQDENLRKEWELELEQMRNRIQNIRLQLMEGLNIKKLGKDFNFMKLLKGLFVISGLTMDQVAQLKQEYAIYMLSNGRISLAGLNKHNVQYVIDSIAAVLK